MGVVFFVATCVVLIVCRPTFADINCEDDVDVNCPSIALYSSFRASDGFVSENMLLEHCSDILEGMTCKSNYINACDHGNYQLYSLLTNGLINLFTGLCNETSYIRKGYAQHRDCFKRTSSQWRICLFRSLEAARRVQSSNTGRYFPLSQEQQQVATLCTYQESFRSCTIDIVRNSCNEEAARYLATFYSVAIQDIVSEIC